MTKVAIDTACHRYKPEVRQDAVRVWSGRRSQAKEQWGRLTDDDLAVVAGRRDQFVGKIQELYGVARAEAERQLTAWEGKMRDTLFG